MRSLDLRILIESYILEYSCTPGIFRFNEFGAFRCWAGAGLFDLAPVLFDRISPIRLQGGAGTDQSEYRLANCSPESNTEVPGHTRPNFAGSPHGEAHFPFNSLLSARSCA